MSLKYAVAKFVAGIISKSYYLTQMSRLVVRIYDNDCNEDMRANGEEKALKLVLSKRGPDSVVVDVGANNGNWCAMLISNGYNGRLVAVDPLANNLAMVRKNLNALGYSDFELMEYALSNKEGELSFYINTDSTLSGHDSLYDMRNIGYGDNIDCIQVQCKTLDQMSNQLKIDRIDYLKIDVEGNELSVLQGASKLLSLDAIDYIQIEFGHAARAAGVYLHDIVNFLEEYNYQIYVIKPSGLLRLDFTPFTENRYAYINFLLVNNNVVDELNGHILQR